jgi:hypothetical protein
MFFSLLIPVDKEEERDMRRPLLTDSCKHDVGEEKVTMMKEMRECMQQAIHYPSYEQIR